MLTYTIRWKALELDAVPQLTLSIFDTYRDVTLVFISSQITLFVGF